MKEITARVLVIGTGCAGYNAAFAIYWMAANVIQVVQQVIVNWYFDRKDRIAAMAEEGADKEIK